MYEKRQPISREDYLFEMARSLGRRHPDWAREMERRLRTAPVYSPPAPSSGAAVGRNTGWSPGVVQGRGRPRDLSFNSVRELAMAAAMSGAWEPAGGYEAPRPLERQVVTAAGPAQRPVHSTRNDYARRAWAGHGASNSGLLPGEPPPRQPVAPGTAAQTEGLRGVGDPNMNVPPYPQAPIPFPGMRQEPLMPPLTLGDFTVPPWDPDKAMQDVDRHSLGQFRQMPYHQPGIQPLYGDQISGSEEAPTAPPWMNHWYGTPEHQAYTGSSHSLTFIAQPWQDSSMLFPGISQYYDKVTNSLGQMARNGVKRIIDGRVNPTYQSKFDELLKRQFHDWAQQIHPERWPAIAAQELINRVGPGITIPSDFRPNVPRQDSLTQSVVDLAKKHRGGPNANHPLLQQNQTGTPPPNRPWLPGPLEEYRHMIPDVNFQFKLEF